MSKTPPVGLRHQVTVTVEPGLTVPEVSPAFANFQGMPAVFATAYLVALIEETCVQALKPYLGENQRSVGTHIDVSHTAATPVGMKATCEVELTAIEGPQLTFRIECRDDIDSISTGTHQRFIVDLDRFNARLEKKRAKGTETSGS
jgi:fluoroacetyl-CoA thioesterase